MNEEFETLPFMAGEGEGEMEEERGRMMAGGGRGGGGRPVHRSGGKPGRGPVARPAPRPPGPPRRPGQSTSRGARYPRGPYWGPVYGWPVGVMVSEPMGYPVLGGGDPWQPPDDAAAPQFEPGAAADNGLGPGHDDGAQGQDSGGDGEQGELPVVIRRVIASLPEDDRPRYVLVGSLPYAHGNPKASGAGLYMIKFKLGSRLRVYSGQTDNLQRRINEHIAEGRRLGLSLDEHWLYVARPGWPEHKRRAVEYRIHDIILSDKAMRPVLTNTQREQEWGR